MVTSEWRERLLSAVEASGRAWTDIAISAGLSKNYLFSILTEGREPSIERMMALADELKISSSWLLFGAEMTPDIEELIRMYAALPKFLRERVLRDVKEKLDDEQRQQGE